MKAIAEDGFDPSTSGLWAQHAPTAPLCWVMQQSGSTLISNTCTNTPYLFREGMCFGVFFLADCNLISANTEWEGGSERVTKAAQHSTLEQHREHIVNQSVTSATQGTMGQAWDNPGGSNNRQNAAVNICYSQSQ